MRESGKWYQFDVVDGVAVVTLFKLLDMAGRDIDGMLNDLKSFLTQHSLVNVAFDMGKLEFLPSSGLGLLIRCKRLTASMGGETVLCHLSHDIREVLAITKLHYLFELLPDVAAAVERLQGDRRGVRCPLEACRGWAPLPAATQPTGPVSELTVCPQCGCRMTVYDAPKTPDRRSFARIEIPTRAGTTVRLAPVSDEMTHRLRGPHLLQVEGELDVSATDAMEELRQVLPSSRRLVVDLRLAKSVTPKGVEGTIQLVLSEPSGHCCVLISPANHPLAGMLNAAVAPHAAVFDDEQQAIAALELKTVASVGPLLAVVRESRS
jgi:anti-anti-sigma factor